MKKKNQANPSKHLNLGQIFKTLNHETLNPGPIQKFFLNHFKNINLKNLTKKNINNKKNKD
jgi:hypothetical protein